MIYVEWLRARRRLVIFAAILTALTLLVVLLGEFGTADVTAGGHHFSIGWPSSAESVPARVFIRDQLQRVTIPLDGFLGFATVVALLFTFGVYTSLHAQTDSLHLAFTKPISRTRLSLGFFAVDLASIAAISVLAALLALVPIAVFGGLDRVVAPHPFIIVGFGGIVLLYGWMQAGTAWMRRGCGPMVATLWVSFAVVPSLTQTPFPQLNALARALSVLDPVRYLRVNTTGDAATWATGVSVYGPDAALAWGLGIVACAVAVLVWNRVQV